MNTSTTDQGNAFRDLVARMLSAGGFRVSTEAREDFKKIDIRAIWDRDDFEGTRRIFIEAKHHKGTLNKSEVTEFLVEYGKLRRTHACDRAWLVSSGTVSADCRKLLSDEPDLTYFTFEEFQRALLRIDAYLMDILSEYDRSGLQKYYVRLRMKDGRDLENYILEWLDDCAAPPIALVGAYGKGKSTFAKHIAATLARAARSDATKRAPILLPLAQIMNEQSPQGLIGKHLAGIHRVQNYHFSLFSELNAAGRFVLIFDGFDEMKHGMTPSDFERNIDMLMSFDRENAKIIMTGRDTAFHDEEEFRSIILGRRKTIAGREIAANARRACQPIEVDIFSIDDVSSFVKNYLPWKVQQAKRAPNLSADPTWMDGRISEILEEKYQELISRPVHAQMLCDIAAQTDGALSGTSKFGLYDSFVHILLEREFQKPGRDKRFSIADRRKFNALVAWWLWKNGASTIGLSDIPDGLCDAIDQGVNQDYDSTGLKRELTAGLLIEKSGSAVFFSHRSIHEFLVAECLFEYDLCPDAAKSRSPTPRIESAFEAASRRNSIIGINREIVDFIDGRMEVDPKGMAKADRWFDKMGEWPAGEIPFISLELYVSLAKRFQLSAARRLRSCWHFWIWLFGANNETSFYVRDPSIFYMVEDAIVEFQEKSPSLQAGVFFAIAHAMARYQHNDIADRMASFVAATLPRAKLASHIAASSTSRKLVVLANRKDSLPLWVWLKSWQISTTSEREVVINIDLNKVIAAATTVLPGWPASESMERSMEGADSVTISMQALFSSMVNRHKANNKELDAIRRYFTDERVRNMIAPIVREEKRGNRAGM